MCPQGKDGIPGAPGRSHLERDLEVGFTLEAGSANRVPQEGEMSAGATWDPLGHQGSERELPSRPCPLSSAERDVLFDGASHRPFELGRLSQDLSLHLRCTEGRRESGLRQGHFFLLHLLR